MDTFKSIFASKAFWGAVLAILSGIPLLAKNFAGVDIGQLASQLASLGTTVGSIVALFGRTTATTQLVVSPTVARIANANMEMGRPPALALDLAKSQVKSAA